VLDLLFCGDSIINGWLLSLLFYFLGVLALFAYL
jgi:hypothetical protein